MAIKLRNHSNDDLMRVDYSKSKVIKDLLHNWKGLERMSLKGDRVATCILVDLKEAIGLDVIKVDKKDYIKMIQYRNKEVLTEDEFIAVVFVLVLGYSQPEVAHIFDCSRQWVGKNIKFGLWKISRYLCRGVNGEG